MNIFELFGKIGIDNKSANKAIDETVGNAEKGSGKIISTFKKMAGILGGLFAGKKIFDFGKSAVEAAATAKAIQSQFDQVFGDLKGKAQEQLNGIAKEVGALPNRIKPAFNQIASFAKVSGMNAQQSLDYASRATMAAADSAAFYDKSLEETTETLKSYLKGNYEVADNLGILSTEQTRNAKATAMFGKEFKELDGIQKQEVLMAMFEDANKVSGAMGQAARESNGFENVMGNLKQVWQDFLVIVGGPLLSPVVTGLQNATTWLQEASKWTQDLMTKLEQNGAIQSFKTAFDNISSVLGDVTGSIGDFVNNLLGIDGKSASVDSVAGSFKKVSDFLADATGGIKDFVDWFQKGGPAVGTLKSAIIGVTTAWTGYKAVVSVIQGIEAAKNLVLGVGNGLMIARAVQSGALTAAEGAQAAATVAGTGAQWAFNAAMAANPIMLVVIAIAALVAGLVYFFTQTEIGREVWSNFVSFLGTVWDSVVNAWTVAWGAITAFFEPIVSNISAFVKSIFGDLQQWWSENQALIQSTFEIVWNAIKFVWETVLSAMMAYVTTAWSFISTVITTVLDVLGPYIAAAWEAIKTTVITVWSVIQNNIMTVINVIQGIIKAVMQAINGDWSGAWETIKGVASTIWNGIKSNIDTVINGISSVISSVMSGISGTVSNIWNGIKSSISNAINGAKDAVSNAINAIKGLFNFQIRWPHIPLPHFSISGSANPLDWLKGGVPKIGIEWYAKGGIMTAPTLFGFNGNNAMVGGEAGPEAVLPLNKKTLGPIGESVADAWGIEDNDNRDLLERIIEILLQLLDKDTDVYLDLEKVGRMTYDEHGRILARGG